MFYSFLSGYDFKPELRELRKILRKHHYAFSHIAGTKDYFCRDYMPVQVDRTEFIRFRFHPDYLLKDPEKIQYVSDTEEILRKNRFMTSFRIRRSEIILDGGNVIRSKKRVIVTDKVCSDNGLSKEGAKRELEGLFGARVMIIPRYPGEETGHADGIIRFIRDDTVLTIALEDEDPDWKNELLNELAKEDLHVISLPATRSPGTDWRYINYLHVGNLVIVPRFENESDKIILPCLKEMFNSYGIRMETLYAENIARHGGVLNCFTWNILE